MNSNNKQREPIHDTHMQLSSRIDDNSGRKPPNGMMFGLDANSEKAAKFIKQQEYKRQLDASSQRPNYEAPQQSTVTIL